MNNIDKILHEYGFTEDQIGEIKELPSGINHVFIVEVNEKKYVLKEYIKLKFPNLDNVHEIVINLIARGLDIPKIFRNKKGNYLTKIGSSNFDLSEFIEHIDYSDQINISKDHLTIAGAKLAEFQNALSAVNTENKLERVDFQNLTDKTLEAIDRFKQRFTEIYSAAKKKNIHSKLKLLLEIIEKTDKYRVTGVDNFSFIKQEEYVPTHGDFSMVNALFTKNNRMFLIDWDGLKLRPAVWDLQAGLSLFSSKYQGNAYIIEPDLKKLNHFLLAYLTKEPEMRSKLNLLSEVVKFNFSIYWLSYTMPAVLSGDFRLLSLIPERAENALFWVNHFSDYEKFIKSF